MPAQPLNNSFEIPASGYASDTFVSITTSQLLTAEDLWRLPTDQRRELVKGALYTMAPAGFEHGAVIDNLQFLLTAHVRQQRLGIVVGAETGFLLARNPDTVLGADIGFVSTSRLPPGGRPQGYFPGPPDLAVEVLSPNDTTAQVANKVDDYLNAGAKLVWVVNPRSRCVTIHRTGQTPVLLSATDTLTDDRVVPGFQCSVAEIFA
jgi:Uma2 family endonuclease